VAISSIEKAEQARMQALIQVLQVDLSLEESLFV